MNKRKIYICISGLLARAFTIYAALDTFVISETYASAATVPVSDAAAVSAENDAGSVENAGLASSEQSDVLTDTVTDAAVITDTSYSDSNISITITTYREYDTDIYVADISLSSADYLQTALAKASYGKNITETTSEIADSVGAILAINGDYYGVQESGYVIRGGVLYRSVSKGDQEDLVIYRDGSMEIINENDITAEELLEDGAWNVLCFGPGLVVDGEIQVTTDQEVDKAMTSNPRTAIGKIDDLHYLFVVADGRTTASAGLSLYQLAEFMQSLGVEMAYNLDGGGSSTMVFNGNVINQPASGHSSHSKNSSSESSERSVSDIVYIGY